MLRRLVSLAAVAPLVIIAAIGGAAGGGGGDPAEREGSGGSRQPAPSVAPSGPPHGAPSTSPAICEGTVLFVDRALVPTTRELVEAAEAVVVGELGTNGSVRSRSSDGRFVHMAYGFWVTDALLGPLSEGAVVQLAGITLDATGCIVREADAEPMVPGGRYLAFIAPSPRGDGVHVAVGGPQGLFSVGPDGTLRPLDPGAPTAVDFAGRTVSEIAGRLSAEGS